MDFSTYIYNLRAFSSLIRKKILQKFLVSILLVSLSSAFLFSFLTGLIIFIIFILGVYVPYKYYNDITRIFCDTLPIEELETNQGCGVCGNVNCTRQKPVEDKQPWVGLDVPKEVDQALQDLLNKILNDFVNSWYGKFSKDESFIYELRLRFRFFLSVILRRIIKTDFGEMICRKLIPIGLRHLEVALLASRNHQENNLTLNVGKLLSDKIHPAAKSRKAELDYLRSISRCLIQIGLSKEDLQCKAVPVSLTEIVSGWLLLLLSDTLCNPYILNRLFWLALTYKPDQSQSFNGQKVQFLQMFVSRLNEAPKSPIYFDLSTALKDQKLLFAFMQFLKTEGVVNHLQFCLAVDDFNQRLNVADLSNAASEKLYREALTIFSLYFKSESPDFIHCSASLVQQLNQVLRKEKVTVQDLLTSSLFDIFNEIFNILDQIYLPRFYQSHLFFKFITEESKPVISHSSSLGGSPVKNRAAAKKSNEPFVIKLSQKLQKLVQLQPVEGSTFYIESGCDVIDAVDELDLLGPDFFRSIADWKINFSVVQNFYKITIVSREDNETWDVHRTVSDFYLLSAKIMEHHKNIYNALILKNQDFIFPITALSLENKRLELEKYLQHLMQIPEMQKSELLYNFLRNPHFASNIKLPFLNSPIYGRKTKGRYLEEFLSKLCESTQSVWDLDWPNSELTETVRYKRCITRGVFGDNFADLNIPSGCQQGEMLSLTSIWDSLLFALETIFESPDWMLKVILTAKAILGDKAEITIHSFVNNKLDELVKPSSLAHLLRLLQGAISSPKSSPSAEEIANIHQTVLKLLHSPENSLFLNFIVNLTVPNWRNGIAFILDVFQHPKLNKHLYYCLLDEVIKVILPELNVPQIK